MSRILMLVMGSIALAIVLQYFIVNVHYKKYGKEKKQISDELIERLKG